MFKPSRQINRWKCGVCGQTFTQKKDQNIHDFEQQVFDTHITIHLANKEYPNPQLETLFSKLYPEFTKH